MIDHNPFALADGSTAKKFLACFSTLTVLVQVLAAAAELDKYTGTCL